MKADPEIETFMKKEKMYVKGLYEIPEVRAVTPGHLVRCGHSSAYDVNFGKEAGGAAVLLLKNNITGVTVAGVSGKRIQYMKTAEAIKQRYVDLDLVSFHERIGVCFGREKAADLKLEFEEIKAPVQRHL